MINMLLYLTLASLIHGGGNKFQIPAPTWNDKFKLHDRLYSMSDIQNYRVYHRKHEALTYNPPARIYIINPKSRIIFEIKSIILHFMATMLNF